MSRLFVSDLDGTLLDAGAQLSRFTREQLVDLLAAGMQFSVASARSIHTIAPIVSDLPLALPVIEFNGAFITDLRTRTPLSYHALDPHIAESAARWALESGIPPIISTYAGGEQRLYPPREPINPGVAAYLEGRRRAGDPRLRAPAPLARALSEHVTCVTLIGRVEALTPIEAQIHGAFPGQTNTLCYDDPYNRGWYWLTLQSVHATKDRALRELSELCGVAIERVTVFGDEINDVPMFRAAGRGVAVENAIPELRRIAHEVIGPHHEDSVARYLRRVHEE
jgi:5-amino-6-(5-phospho-D-ribitylamino)uracil phosphatase